VFMTGTTGRLVEPLTGRSWDAPEIRARVLGRLADYAALKLAAGDRVFLHYGNTLEFFIDILAVWQLGACVVPVDGRLTAYEITTLAESARPRVCVWDAMPEEGLVNTLAGLGVASIAKPAAQPGTTGISAPGSRLRLDAEALILYTSGTTGNPKGVVHTHRSLRARWASLAAAVGVQSFQRTLCLLPTHFGHGLICNCLFPWLYGQDLYVLPPFRADSLARLGSILDEHAITFMSSVPTVWRLAIKIAPPPRNRSLKRIFCGSAPLSAGLWQSIQEWSGIKHVVNAYGITETGSWLAGLTEVPDQPEDGLVGQAWGGVLRVLRNDDTATSFFGAEDCAPGEPGHVWINTPALMKGYLDRDDLTSAVVTDGWFSTGDIGYLDDRRYLYLRGRQREEINKGGMKVHPTDVDAVIERFDQTMDVCTFAMADPLLGEDVAVAVVLRDGSDATLLALRNWTAVHLAPHQIPKRWYRLDEIPRTSRGKVNRADVAKHCLGQTPIPYARLMKRGA
jgi:acyl-CoA synthetase (AMP-forming)/AMP-acid ligase II